MSIILNRILPFKFENQCIEYIQKGKKDILKIADTNVLINRLIDYGASSQIFSTNLDLIIKITLPYENEILALDKAYTCVRDNLTCHFIVCYGFSKCSNISFNTSINKSKKTKLTASKTSRTTKSSNDFNDMVNSLVSFHEYIKQFYENILLIFLEQFDDNMLNVIYHDTIQYNDNMIKSAFTQMILAIASFHYLVQAIHDDAQLKNFFIKKDKNYDASSKAYLHYNICGEDIYLRYYGFIIVLADYGNVNFEFDNNQIKLIKDYEYILDDRLFKKCFQREIDVNKVMQHPNMTEAKFLSYMKDTIFKNENIFRTSIEKHSKVINPIPYVIY